MLSIALLISLTPALAFGRPKCHQSCGLTSEHESPKTSPSARTANYWSLCRTSPKYTASTLCTLITLPKWSTNSKESAASLASLSMTMMYMLCGGNFTIEDGSVLGSYRVDSLDLTGAKPKATRIADFPTAQFLNGMAFLPRWGQGPRNVLVNDVIGGVVYHLDPISGDHHIALNNTYMQAHQHPVLGSFGVNGIKVGDRMAYLTNTGLGVLVRFPIHPNGTEVEGGLVEILSRQDNSTWFYDDFALWDTSAYVITGSGNSIRARYCATGRRAWSN
ncbi:hypothetical protein FACUT_13874 [Fusarium acutatum]|uniref:Trichothecene biosynthesis protein n=1 Tax=Fusarium acutatum TaxID=78861 RepID=A0A8H4JAZ6_9HYPO|nr:hypothetical protein FACUT_13874 [Fusarium acutatum]